MFGFRSFALCAITLALSHPFASAAPWSTRAHVASPPAAKRDSASSSDKLVFCHFMIGIVSNRKNASDYDSDMQLAKDLGIDAFALNIGTDNYTDTQLAYAYDSASKNDMKVFISFDFNWFSTDDADKVGTVIANYSSHAAQLFIDDKVFASSFAGDGLDVAAVKKAAGQDIYFAPNFSPDKTDNADVVDGALNWMGWDTNGNNKAPTSGSNVTVVEGDVRYNVWLGTKKSYIAPVSPWFSTHYGTEVSYSKNFVFPSDLLWQDRWGQVLTKKPEFVEIITWNDYGESHYIGPLSSRHYDDGASKWVNDMPHDGFRDIAKPYIAAFKAGATSPDEYITQDQIVYWYRPHLSSAECDSTDNTMGGGSTNNASGNYFHGKPNGWEALADSVFVVAMLTANGTVTVTSGDNRETFEATAGVNSFEVDLAAGQQQFTLTRGPKTVLNGTSLKDVEADCICGIYNFNTFVGTLPEQAPDSLDADGLASFTIGLSVTTCLATPSLATPTAVAASTTAAAGHQQATATASAALTPAGPTSSNKTTTATLVVATATRSQKASAYPASATATASSSSSTCNAGTNAADQSGNFLGLCSFACARGFCPEPACQCTSTGAVTASLSDSVTGDDGCGLPGEEDDDDMYDDLCAFTCNLGYCPDTACTSSCS